MDPRDDLSLCAFHFVLFLMRHNRGTVSEPAVTYCAVFACNSQCGFLSEVLVGSWLVCLGFFLSCM